VIIAPAGIIEAFLAGFENGSIVELPDEMKFYPVAHFGLGHE
jgi:hypothetical protein